MHDSKNIAAYLDNICFASTINSPLNAAITFAYFVSENNAKESKKKVI